MFSFSARIGKRAGVEVDSGLVDVFTETIHGQVWLGYVVKADQVLVLLQPVSESQQAELIDAYQNETGELITSTQRPKQAKDFEDD